MMDSLQKIIFRHTNVDSPVIRAVAKDYAAAVNQELLEALETLSIFLPSDHPEPADNDRIQPGFVYIRWGDLRKARAAIARAKGKA